MIYIMTFTIMWIWIQLDFKPADIKHSSLRTMAKHVRRAMLPGNHEVFTRSFAEGDVKLPTPTPVVVLPLMLHHAALQSWMASKFWIFTGLIRLMQWKDLSRSSSIKANCTLLSSLAHQSFTQMIVPLTWPILAWCFRVHILWILEALLCLRCFMLMPPFPDKACPIIPYTVRYFCQLFALLLLYHLYSLL